MGEPDVLARYQHKPTTPSVQLVLLSTLVSEE